MKSFLLIFILIVHFYAFSDKSWDMVECEIQDDDPICPNFQPYDEGLVTVHCKQDNNPEAKGLMPCHNVHHWNPQFKRIFYAHYTANIFEQSKSKFSGSLYPIQRIGLSPTKQRCTKYKSKKVIGFYRILDLECRKKSLICLGEVLCSSGDSYFAENFLPDITISVICPANLDGQCPNVQECMRSVGTYIQPQFRTSEETRRAVKGGTAIR